LRFEEIGKGGIGIGTCTGKGTGCIIGYAWIICTGVCICYWGLQIRLIIVGFVIYTGLRFCCGLLTEETKFFIIISVSLAPDDPLFPV
jgi:hypothetical protein